MVLPAVIALIVVLIGGIGAPLPAAESDATDKLPVRVIRDVAYAHYDADRPLLADIYLPVDGESFPTILMLHGGAWFAGHKGHVAGHARHAAEHGYAVVAINYRLAPKHRFPAQLVDCQAALKWIRSRDHSFPLRRDWVATYGYSAGANLACLVGLQDEPENMDPIRAIVAGGAPCEFSWIPEERKSLSYWLGGSRADVPDQYRLASPTTFVSVGDPPVHLFHGEQDRLVPLKSPEIMKEQLAKKKVEVHLHVIPRAGHMRTYLHPEARRLAIAFLDQKLKLSDTTSTTR